ncbi:TetR/AcrR family transcriptional regulator [Pelagerythrobacter rhizovicinus]|uniref:TetR/AcrR family transcriptional regulator n=1 Tax=Pelagerythrobacter rhizovicinus TaxID=2268576 RepID=A0A4Q2KLS0_9SPHN|nr:TetR/AcrR family transcriptional regulator [Pelagerythrobacter rhizovicinus]RXZ65357.1 TetR/AcrR family transcriptional regulator [Pelagerythrobacter rhizovicinus]
MSERVREVDLQPRMRAQDRVAMMVLEADRQINLRRSARIAPADIAADLGTSRSLFYSYFPDLNALLIAVLDRHADLLLKAGLDRAADRQDMLAAATDSAGVYLDHIVTYGSAIELCFRERWLVRHLHGRMKTLANGVLRKLARKIQGELRYGPREALGIVQILQAMPEEGARLVRSGDISLEMAHDLCRRHITVSLEELRPQPSART